MLLQYLILFILLKSQYKNMFSKKYQILMEEHLYYLEWDAAHISFKINYLFLVDFMTKKKTI